MADKHVIPMRDGKPVWNKPGHGVIAFVAEGVLEANQPNVLALAQGILDNDPAGRGALWKAARWPDDNKSNKAFLDETGPWHYVDMIWEEDTPADPDVALPPGDNAVTKIVELAAALRTEQDAEKLADALSFVLHLAGDLHQPLHCITRVNDQLKAPEGDRGGNLFHLAGKKNLHSLWDGLLVEGDALPETKLRAIADEIRAEFPESKFSRTELSADAATWAREGYALAVTNAYAGIAEKSTPSKPYLENAHQVARRQAALGGYRLARLLVGSLG